MLGCQIGRSPCFLPETLPKSHVLAVIFLQILYCNIAFQQQIRALNKAMPRNRGFR